MNIRFWKKRTGDSKQEVLQSPWARFGIPDAAVQAYLNKNDAIELNVPLQIAQTLLDRSANELVSLPTNNAFDLARAQGVMQGIAMVALELSNVNKEAVKRFRVAGGIARNDDSGDDE